MVTTTTRRTHLTTKEDSLKGDVAAALGLVDFDHLAAESACSAQVAPTHPGREFEPFFVFESSTSVPYDGG
jgi:hypothetical protein